jgi:hypothetical protein
MNMRKWTLRRLGDERGWALMDAIWSVVVVAAAFAASTAAFNVATRSAAREELNSQAMTVAQSQINWMRSVGQSSEANLLALNGTFKQVPYRGTNFKVTYTAVQTAGIGEGGVEACSAEFSSSSAIADLPDDRHYVYMRVVVNYPGQKVTSVSGATGASGPITTGFTAAQPIALDSNYAAEGGLSDQTSGMMRVYVIDQNQQPATVNGVKIRKSDGASDLSPIAQQPDKGCYLFGGLAGGTYTIKVDAGGKQNVFMSAGADNVIQSSMDMQTGVMKSTSVVVATPVSVKPIYKAYNSGTSSTITLDTANDPSNQINPFVKSSTGTGLWTGYSEDVTTAKNSSFFVNQGGGLFPYMPAANSGATDKSMVYPVTAGWEGFAGPCRANDPGTAQWSNVPFDMASPTWPTTANSTVRPEFWLTLLKAGAVMTPVITAQPGSPDTGWGSTERYYWSQTVTSAQVQAALTGDNAGSNAYAECNSGFQLGNTAGNTNMWKQLPNQTTTSGGTLADVPSALPPGTYELCVRLNYTMQTREYYGGSIFFGAGKKWNGSVETWSGVGYMKIAATTVNGRVAPISKTANFSPPNWKKQMSTSASTSSATCGAGWA